MAVAKRSKKPSKATKTRQTKRAGRPKGTGGKSAALSHADVQRIDKCLSGTTHELRNRALLYFGLGTGMRIAEIVGLTIGHVAPHGRVLTEIVLEKHSTKGKKSRTVAVSDQAVQHLRAYLKDRGELEPSAPLFPSQKRPNRPMTTWNAITTLGKMFEAAAVANASSHSLRRTLAQTLDQHGVSVRIIQQQLGHTSLATTQRYLDEDPRRLRNAVAKVRF